MIFKDCLEIPSHSIPLNLLNYSNVSNQDSETSLRARMYTYPSRRAMSYTHLESGLRYRFNQRNSSREESTDAQFEMSQ